MSIGSYLILAMMAASMGQDRLSQAPAAAPEPTVEQQAATSGGMPLAEFAFDYAGGHIVVPVRIRGSRPLRMVLDTGMSAPVVLLTRPGLAAELGLEGGEPVLLAGAGGGEPAGGRVFSEVPVTLGGLEQPGQNIIVLDEAGPPGACVQDGVIGKSIFDRYAVTIDFDRSMLSLHDSETAPRSYGEILPITFNSGIPVVEAAVELEDRRKVPVRLVVDFGARHGLSLDTGGEKGIEPPEGALEGSVGTGILGNVKGRIGRIRSLRLGSFVFEKVLTSFTARESGTTCAAGGVVADGNLGVEILSRFDVTIDYRHSRLLVVPNARFGAPFDYNMAGLSLVPGKNDTLLVRDVVVESPAAAAGILEGDRIVAIEGRGVGGYSHVESIELFRREGEAVTVEVERNGERFERTLKLRRLI